MVRSFNSSQLRSQLNRIQSQQRAAINRLQSQQRTVINQVNQAVRDYNNAVNRYNSAARTHNAKVRADRQRLQNELSRLASASRSTSQTRVSYRTTTTTLNSTFQRVEQASDSGLLRDPSFLDHAESEAANGLATYNALSAEPIETDEDDSTLRQSTLDGELSALGGDLDQRWRGAVFALSPSNPDAARHFSSSAREILVTMVDGAATDAEVLALNPNAPKTDQGSITRRARIQHCLKRKGEPSAELADFVEADIENVLSLFYVLNEGTHGGAGVYDVRQLSAIKGRTEEAIRFVARLTSR